MSQPANHWKLGMFIVVALVLGVAAGGYFGSRALAKKTLGFLTYFDEPVTGLEVGSAIKFRGVTMGQVSRIKVAHDFRHVEVGYELEVGALLQLVTGGNVVGQSWPGDIERTFLCKLDEIERWHRAARAPEKNQVAARMQDV